jgi:hypothetical protein
MSYETSVLHHVEHPLSGNAKAFQQVFERVWKDEMGSRGFKS